MTCRKPFRLPRIQKQVTDSLTPNWENDTVPTVQENQALPCPWGRRREPWPRRPALAWACRCDVLVQRDQEGAHQNQQLFWSCKFSLSKEIHIEVATSYFTYLLSKEEEAKNKPRESRSDSPIRRCPLPAAISQPHLEPELIKKKKVGNNGGKCLHRSTNITGEWMNPWHRYELPS